LLHCKSGEQLFCFAALSSFMLSMFLTMESPWTKSMFILDGLEGFELVFSLVNFGC
jgi:hypothetical protein